MSPLDGFAVYLHMIHLSGGLWEAALVGCIRVGAIWEGLHFLERHKHSLTVMLEEHLVLSVD